jgi:hypothetical protein
MSTNKLENCPLCGKNDLKIYEEAIPLVGGDILNVGVIECLTPDCPVIIREPTINKAIEKWNKRPDEEILQTKLNILYSAIKNSIIYFPNAEALDLLKNALKKAELEDGNR